MVSSFDPTVTLIGEVEASNDAKLKWAVATIDLLFANVFTKSFPRLDVIWGIEDDTEPNASAWSHVTPSVLLVTRGAVEQSFDVQARFAGAALTFAKDYAFPAGAIGPGADATVLLAHAGSNLGAFALATLVAHEIGHAHDRQIDREKLLGLSDQHFSVIDTAFEVTADTWGIRACSELAIGWAQALSRGTDMPLDIALRCAVYYTLLGNGVMEDIDWKAAWTIPGLGSDAHPPGAFRLFATAVAISERLFEREIMSGPDSGALAVDVFGVVAQTLYWLETGREVDPEVFRVVAAMRIDKNPMVDTLREAYEAYRTALS